MQSLKQVEERLAQIRATMEIRCPKCKYLFDWEDMEGHITYHGEDGPEEDECPNCDCKLTITEDVTRTWEVKVKDDSPPDDDK